MSAALSTDVDARALRTTKFPAEFNIKLDTSKVNKPVIKKWISDRITTILSMDDDVVSELIFDEVEKRFPNIKALQITLGGFLNKDAPQFCAQLWSLLISAEKSPSGVPKELLEAKKQELERERLEEEQARDLASRRQETERDHEREVDDLRRRDRADRHDRYDRDRRSPSPPRRRRDRSRDRSPPRDTDSYVPRDRRYRDDRRQRRSPSYDDRRLMMTDAHAPDPMMVDAHALVHGLVHQLAISDTVHLTTTTSQSDVAWLAIAALVLQEATLPTPTQKGNEPSTTDALEDCTRFSKSMQGSPHTGAPGATREDDKPEFLYYKDVGAHRATREDYKALICAQYAKQFGRNAKIRIWAIDQRQLNMSTLHSRLNAEMTWTHDQ
ncbi:hypothetical protein AMS68_001910 [Peltaster fructicola]|uniref:PWI domain-containing protein n=1 Tax=Peltaster fructicola TaxID=286661 RepID=A0A6H0XNV1_9PEZI|nr:hypothetical protein AMS68_001910 [Peltaster fructicola]